MLEYASIERDGIMLLCAGMLLGSYIYTIPRSLFVFIKSVHKGALARGFALTAKP